MIVCYLRKVIKHYYEYQVGQIPWRRERPKKNVYMCIYMAFMYFYLDMYIYTFRDSKNKLEKEKRD